MTAVTSAAAWKSKTTEIVELPSGNTAELRKSLSMVSLIRRGVLTEDLINVLDSAMSGEAEDAIKAIQVQDIFVSEMFVSPIVTDDPEAEDAVYIDDLDPDDVEFVLTRAMDSIQQVDDSFRDESERDGTSPSGEDVEPKPKPKPRARAGKR